MILHDNELCLVSKVITQLEQMINAKPKIFLPLSDTIFTLQIN